MQRSHDIAGIVMRAEERGGQAAVGKLLRQRSAIKSCAQSNAVVAGHGLHIHIVEEAGAEEFAVGRAVERDSAGESNTPQSGLSSKVFADMHHHPLQALLQRGGHVFMRGVDRLIGRATRNQIFVEVGARGGVSFALFAGLIQLEHGNADGAIVLEFHGLLKEGAEARRIAVRREAHDFVFVGVEIEAEMEGDERVENADGIVGADGAQLFHLAVVKVVDGKALNLAHGVVDDDERFIPARSVSGARGVGQVMADLVNFIERKGGQVALYLVEQDFFCEDLVVEAGRDFVLLIEAAIGCVVEAVGDLIDVVDGEAGLSEAEFDGVDRKVTGMFLAAKALLLGRGD